MSKLRLLLLVVIFSLATVGQAQNDLAAALHNKPPQKVDVVIIGAGLSGLTTAYHLSKTNLTYHILEVTPRVGGRVRTMAYQWGDTVLYADSGMEEFWESNPLVPILKELGLPLHHDEGFSSQVIEGKLYPGTEEGFEETIFNAEDLKTCKALQEEIKKIVDEIDQCHQADRRLNAELMKLKEISFADWVLGHKISPRVANWLRVLMECEFGATWSKTAALDGLAECHMIFEGCYRVRNGNERFTDALAKKIGIQNISVNKRVSRVVSGDKQVAVYYADTAANTSHVIHAAHVVSTIPLFKLFEVQFEPPLSAVKQKAIETMSWGSYFKAHIFVPNSAKKYWTHEGKSLLTVISDSELGVIYDGNQDQENATKILSLLVIADYAEDFNMMELDAVRAKITAALDKLWPGIGKEVLGIEFYRFHPRAVAGWAPGRSRFDDLSEAVRQPEHRVYLAGDFTENSHTSGSAYAAERVVRQILAAEAQK